MIVEKDGNILSVHCKCMAGLGESCTHAAALLFTLDTMVQLKKSRTVTQVPCYWKEKSFKEVAYVPDHQIDFRSAKGKRKALNDALMGTAPSTSAQAGKPKKEVHVPPMSDEELKNYFQAICYQKSGTKPAILSLVKGFEEDYKPKKDDSLPPALGDLSTAELKSLSVSKEQISAVEEKTRLQAKSQTWHCVRAGRLTASILHSATHTCVEKPAKSVISSVLFGKKVAGKAIDWGVNNEKRAKEAYVAKVKDMHEGFSLKDCGFCIHPDSPFIGASPDGIRECNCCGTVTVEVKCPFKHKSSYVKEAAQDKDFCLGVNENDELFLKDNHPYYSQVQAQISAVQAEYCDFVVWTEVDIAVVKVLPNADKWRTIAERAKLFFDTCIIPLLANDKDDVLGAEGSVDFVNDADGVDVSGVDSVLDVLDDVGRVVDVVNDAGCVVDLCGVAGKAGVCDADSGDRVQESHRMKPVKVDACDVVESEDVDETDVKRAVLSPLKKQARVDCESHNASNVYCSCKGDEYGRMICCDNENCPIGWYHYLCEGITRKPKGQWYCKMCSQLPQFRFRKAQPKARKLVNKV